mgnify:CR=1 FL=1
MTDAEYVFKKTDAERKSMGHGARAKKCGSKSKKCSLPSDNLTASEIKKMNGECKSYDLAKPMRWDVFRALPHDLQSEYIRKLSAMGASRVDICDMFACSEGAYSQYMNVHHKGERFFDQKNLRYRNNDEFVAWFCGESGIQEAVLDTAKAESPKAKEPEPADLPTLMTGTVTYTGIPQAVFQQIMGFMGAGRRYKITVSFEQTDA